MKKIIALIVLAVLCLSLLGCEYGLEYYKVELLSYPDKMVYIQNVDDKLDMTGFSAKLYNRTSEYDYTVENDDYFDYAEPEDYAVDFSKEGLYNLTFSIYHQKDRTITFPIYVVSAEKVEEMYSRISEK